MAGVVLLAGTVILASTLGLVLEGADSAKIIKNKVDLGLASYDKGEFHTAKAQFDAASELLDHLDNLDVRKYATRWRRLPETLRSLAAKLRELKFGPNLDEMKDLARDKGQLAERYARTRDAADALFQAALRLRFRLLLGAGGNLTDAIEELKFALQPFYVLEADDWTKLDHILVLLDDKRFARLQVEVNELLFLWMATIDESLSPKGEMSEQTWRASDRELAARAVAICDRALAFAEPKQTWRTLKARLERAALPANELAAPPLGRIVSRIEGEPRDVAEERSALACFEWALLWTRTKRPARAIEWMRQAVRLEPGNYWYQYFLAYVEDQAGLTDDALNHYSSAVALQPRSPWVWFSRARIYRSKGRWAWAIDDMRMALNELGQGPESRQVHLELGYLYQELGDFPRARAEYNSVLAANVRDDIARAARLNLANIDVESGAIDRARAEYDELLGLEPGDTAVRQSRALLELRMGQAERAEHDLTALLDLDLKPKNPNEILEARALARLLLGRTAQAMADASKARRAHPCPAHERLWQRTVLAARRAEHLDLDQPQTLALLPLGGRRLEADLRAAADALARIATARGETAYRALLTRSVILAFLGESKAAIADASRALALSPFSVEAYLVRARIGSFVGDRAEAMRDVERGLAIQVDHPGLIELHGVLRQAEGDLRGALEDYDWAIAWGAVDDVHSRKASALVAVGDYEAAIHEWSLALRRDPELPEAFLGRARTYLQIRDRDLTDLALADLEQAASWAHSDARFEAAVVGAYLQCLKARPDRLPRLLTLAGRAAGDLWRSLEDRSRMTAGLP
jgi:tetratricopeptide (TPR) repeat protein